MAPSHASSFRKGGGEALTGVHTGTVLSREINPSGCRRCYMKRKATRAETLSRVSA